MAVHFFVTFLTRNEQKCERVCFYSIAHASERASERTKLCERGMVKRKGSSDRASERASEQKNKLTQLTTFEQYVLELTQVYSIWQRNVDAVAIDPTSTAPAFCCTNNVEKEHQDIMADVSELPKTSTYFEHF